MAPSKGIHASGPGDLGPSDFPGFPFLFCPTQSIPTQPSIEHNKPGRQRGKGRLHIFSSLLRNRIPLAMLIKLEQLALIVKKSHFLRRNTFCSTTGTGVIHRPFLILIFKWPPASPHAILSILIFSSCVKGSRE